MKKIKVFAPASIANLGCGFDIMGMALDEVGDVLEMTLIDGGLEEMEVDDEYLTLYTAYEDYGNMVKMLEELKIEFESA